MCASATLEPGPTDSIADVGDVSVGHVTVVRDEPDPPEGRGAARSGVTAVVPGPLASLHAEPLAAGIAVLNGAGELTGSHELAEWGELATPVYLTATMSVGRVYDGAVAAAVAADPRMGVDDVVIPVVGECDDSWLNDARVVQVEADDVSRALADAELAAEVVQGAVGAGTGMVCFDWKGGIGSSSRLTGEGHTLGVLVLANFGDSPELRVDGVPVGPAPGAGRRRAVRPGSCIAVVATDAPLGSAQLNARRPAGRARPRPHRIGRPPRQRRDLRRLLDHEPRPARRPAAARAPRPRLDPLFQATVEATEEAVLNALWHAETTTGREGRVVERLPHEPVLELLKRHGRLAG